MRERPSNTHDWSRISLRSIRATGWPRAANRGRFSLRAARLVVGTAHDSPKRAERECQRLCPPYKSGPRLRADERLDLKIHRVAACHPPAAPDERAVRLRQRRTRITEAVDDRIAPVAAEILERDLDAG